MSKLEVQLEKEAWLHRARGVFVCCALMLFLPVAEGVVLGGSESLPAVVTETIPTQIPTQEIPLIIHRMPTMPASLVSRNQRFLYADETLFTSNATQDVEFEWCKNAGAVAVIQDSMPADSVQAAREAGLKLILLPNMSPFRLDPYGASIEDPESVARYLVTIIQETEQYSDALYHQDGKLVMWLFAATSVPAEYYQTVRQKVRELGYDPMILYQAQLVGDHRTPAVVEEYLRMFDGAFIWGDGYEAVSQMVEMVVSARDVIENETNVRKQVVLTSKPGHWRPESGLFIDAHGTREFRKTIDLAYQYQLDGLNIESWNDFSEMHQVQPTILKSTVLADICSYYGRLGVGEPEPVEYPGLYVSHRRDIVAGEYLECEVLCLPVAEPGERTVQLLLRSQDGLDLFSSDPWVVTNTEACAKTFNIPTRLFNVPQTVSPILKINGAEHLTGTFCQINASRTAYPLTMNMSMAKSLHPDTATFSINGHNAGSDCVRTNLLQAEFTIQCDKNISRIEIIKDNMPVYCAAFDQFMRTKSPSNSYQIAGFYWDIPGPVDALEEESLNGQDFGGSITLSNGAAVHAVEANYALSVLESPSYVEWYMDVPKTRPHDGVEIAFEGDEDTVFDVNMPRQSSHFQIRWGDILNKGWQEYPLLSHSRLVVKPMSGPMGQPAELGVTNYSGSVVLPLDEELPTRILNDRNQSTYFLRVIAEDNSIYRSAPIHVIAAGSNETVRTYTWDMDEETRYEIEVPETGLQDITWEIKEDSPRIIPDLNRVGYALELGGMHERDGRFDPDQIPDIVEDEDGVALEFDGNDIVITRSQTVPVGSWMLDMWIKPTGIGSEQFIFDVPEAISVVLQSNGTLRVWYGDSHANINLFGKTVLRNERWYRLSFIYDLREARLMLDGLPEAAAPVEGFRHRITQKANFGATFPYAEVMARAECGFYGLMKDITITANADKMDAMPSPQTEKPRSSIIYYDDFSGSGSVPLVGTEPDASPGSETWMGLTAGSQWTADGAITNTTWERRNMFLPFTPEPGKIYTLKMDVVRIGTLNTFSFGFVQNANFTGGFPLAADNVGASPWMSSAAINGNVASFLGPNVEGADSQQFTVPDADSMNTLEMVLNTKDSAWTVEYFLNGNCIRTATFATNPVINYVGFGRYNQGTFRIDNFELSVEVQPVFAPIYYDDFSGSGSVPLVGTEPDASPGSETWMGLTAGSQWTADGAITNTTWERRNMFLPFTPEPGKIYTLKMDVVRIGTLNTFSFGFVQNANFTGGFPLAADNVGASPWMSSAAVNGNVASFLGPNVEGADSQQFTVPDADSMNTLEMVLNTKDSAWTVEYFLNGNCIRTATFATNPVINYVGFGRYNQGTFRIDNFELSVEVQPDVIYYDDFSGSETVPLIGTPPDVAPESEVWMGTTLGAQWTADGAITNTTWARRNMFLPFTPESGKIYTLKTDVVRIGTLNTLNFGFVQNANFTGGFPLEADNVGASPWMSSAATNGNVASFLGPNVWGADSQQFTVPDADSMNTLEMVLNTKNPTWIVEYFLNGDRIRIATFATNPVINYVGFGRYNQGTFRIDNFELSVANDLMTTTLEPDEIQSSSLLIKQDQKSVLPAPSYDNFSGSPSDTNLSGRIIYYDDFGGTADVSLSGQMPDVTIQSNSWLSLTTGAPWKADGSTTGDSTVTRGALLPFSPATGNVYTLSMDLNPSSGTRWFELGFTQFSRQDLGFTSDGPGASAWFYLKTDRTLPGVIAGGTFTSIRAGQVNFYGSTNLLGSIPVKIILDTTEPSWSVEWFMNGTSIRTYTYATNPVINYVGFTRVHDSTAGTVDNFLLTEMVSMEPALPEVYSLTKPDPDSITAWNLTNLYQPPATFPAPDFEADAAPGVTPLFYEGEIFTGMITRVFAWVGIPTNGPGPFPGMVLVHGGGGTAYQDWVQLWMDRGYAAIAMDTAGHIPVLPDGATTGWARHDYAGPVGWGGFDQLGSPVGDQWMYHAVAAVIRGHSLLRSYAQVDTNRIGLTGISWGGILTCDVAGLDDRFKFAAPVYGCGFLGEDSYWLDTEFRPRGAEMALSWVNQWDPGRYVGRAQIPMLFVNGSNDKHFRLGSWQKTYQQLQNQATLCCKVRLPHSDIAGRVPEVMAYADSQFKGGSPLPEIVGTGRSNQTVWLAYAAGSVVTNAVLNYTTDNGVWTGRYWQTISALLDPLSRRVSAVLPENTTAYYINLIDEAGMISSSEHEELTGYEHLVAEPKNARLEIQNGRVFLNFDLAATARYHVETTTNLLDPSGWTDNGPAVNYWNSPVRLDGGDTENCDSRYFRVRSYQ